MRIHVKQKAMTKPSTPMTIKMTPSGLDAWKLTVTPGGGDMGARVDLKKSNRASANDVAVVVAAVWADDIATVIVEAIATRVGRMMQMWRLPA